MSGTAHRLAARQRLGRQLGRASTGHATRSGGGAPGFGATNVYMEPGSLTAEQLIGEVERGGYVTQLIGQGSIRRPAIIAAPPPPSSSRRASSAPRSPR